VPLEAGDLVRRGGRHRLRVDRSCHLGARERSAKVSSETIVLESINAELQDRFPLWQPSPYPNDMS
jgi:hypothetical protein